MCTTCSLVIHGTKPVLKQLWRKQVRGTMPTLQSTFFNIHWEINQCTHRSKKHPNNLIWHKPDNDPLENGPRNMCTSQCLYLSAAASTHPLIPSIDCQIRSSLYRCLALYSVFSLRRWQCSFLILLSMLLRKSETRHACTNMSLYVPEGDVDACALNQNIGKGTCTHLHMLCQSPPWSLTFKSTLSSGLAEQI